MAKYDVDRLKSDNPLPDVAGRYIQLKSDGKEFKAVCPFHEDKDPSLNIRETKNGWSFFCFGCHTGGDVIQFIKEIERVDFKGACEILGGKKFTEESKAHKKARLSRPQIDYYADHEALPVPVDKQIETGKAFKAWNPKRADEPGKEFATYKPSMVFPYRLKDGSLIGYVIRVDLKGGRKLTPSIRWVKRPDGTEGWSHFPFDKPRSLYGLDRLGQRGQVILCEGEKAADAAFRLLGLASLSWPGGTYGARHSDFTPLKGRKVVIWGDADEPGEKVSKEIAAILKPIAKEIKRARWDMEKPKGWDAADAEADGLSEEQTLAWLKTRVQQVDTVDNVEELPPVDTYDGEEASEEHPPPEPEKTAKAKNKGGHLNGDTPFKFLGYNHGYYYYLPDSTQQVVNLTPAQHTMLNLLPLAPLVWWENNFPAKTASESWQLAANSLMGKSAQVGVFSDHNVLRGRGAWIDTGDIVIHTGPHLVVNGQMQRPGEYESTFVYEKAAQLSITNAEPATGKQAHRLVEICERLTWESPISGALLAGWCVAAPVCGILHWRPHIWITGQAGSGKSTVLRDVIQRIIGEIGLRVEGNTTEPGLRQALKRDARPIIFDEAESEDKTQAKRMQAVLELARLSSSGAQVLKGSAHGDAIAYTARAAFCFSSINTGVSHYADESRISRLVLRHSRGTKEQREQHYEDLMKDIQEWFTPEYSAKMFSRTLKYIDILLANAKTFTDAAARTLGDRRAADQIGTMLAGYYLCHQSGLIDYDKAVETIRENNWDDHTALAATSDSDRCLERITSHRLRVTASGKDKTIDLTIGELLLLAGGLDSVSKYVDSEDANDELKRFGIRVDSADGTFTVASRGTPLENLYKDTPWSSHGARRRQLECLPGAEKTENPVYFSAGIGRHRGTKLNLALVQA